MKLSLVSSNMTYKTVENMGEHSDSEHFLRLYYVAELLFQNFNWCIIKIGTFDDTTMIL